MCHDVVWIAHKELTNVYTVVCKYLDRKEAAANRCHDRTRRGPFVSKFLRLEKSKEMAEPADGNARRKVC